MALSVVPYEDKLIKSVEFSFVYGYNKNTMTVYNAMLNFTYTGDQSTVQPDADPTQPDTTAPESASTQATTTTEATSTQEPESTEVDYSDYVLKEERIDTSVDYMENSAEYSGSGNYCTKEIDEAGNETAYTYDVDGNITRILDAWGNVLHTKNGSGTEITLFDRIWF